MVFKRAQKFTSWWCRYLVKLRLIPYKRERPERSVTEHKTLAWMHCWTTAWPERDTNPSNPPCQHQHLELDTSKCWQPDAYVGVCLYAEACFSSPLSSYTLQIISVFSRPLTFFGVASSVSCPRFHPRLVPGLPSFIPGVHWTDWILLPGSVRIYSISEDLPMLALQVRTYFFFSTPNWCPSTVLSVITDLLHAYCFG